MQYDIKAIPTTYAGVRFRSRLEARWAAFFDLAGWKWDYEPFDLDGWAPDFIITGSAEILVEIKPISFREKTCDKEAEKYGKKAFDFVRNDVLKKISIQNHSYNRPNGVTISYRDAVINGPVEYEVIILGTGPFRHEGSLSNWALGVLVGLNGNLGAVYSEESLKYFSDFDYINRYDPDNISVNDIPVYGDTASLLLGNDVKFDFTSDQIHYYGRIEGTGYKDGLRCYSDDEISNIPELIWREAGNRVQWRGR